MQYKSNIESMLDIGTGGGEFLNSLQPFPKIVKATEAYKPNIQVARKRLSPLGIDVVGIEKGNQEKSPLPFADNSFDLVINRHECYESREIYRILKPGGHFITQQVGHRDLERLDLIFGSVCENNEYYKFSDFINYLDKAGFSIIEQKEHVANSRFYDIRVVVYYLKIIEWAFPDFDIDRYYKQLENIFCLIKRDGFFEDICHRFFIVAQKR